MSIADELAQAKANVAEYEQCLKAAYTALQSTGASLPEKCNAANLAGTIETGSGYALVFEDSQGGTVAIRNSEDKNYVRAFIDACASSYSSGGVNPDIPIFSYPRGTEKGEFVNVYLNGTGVIGENSYVCGGGIPSTGFTNLKKLELINLETIASNLCAYAATLTDVILHEGLTTIGTSAFLQCVALPHLKLPDSLMSVGIQFCWQCNNLGELYIPANCTPPTDDDSLATRDVTAPAYINGIILKGPGAASWKNALPDSNRGSYRKLILDPEWS